MYLKLWYWLCILFFIINLKSLIDDYYKINYEIVEKDNELYDDYVNYLLCINFKEIKKKDKLFGIKSQCLVSTSFFLNYSISSIEQNLNKTNLIKLNDSFIFFEHICFLVNKSNLENNSLFNYYDNFLYIYSRGKIPFLFETIFNQDEPTEYYLKIHLRKVYSIRYLNNSKCKKSKDQFELSKFNCLNKCLESKYIKPTDNGKFNLNLITNCSFIDKKIFGSNKTELKQNHNEFAKECLRECQNDDCYYEAYNAIRINETYYNKIIKQENIDKIDFRKSVYKPYYSNSNNFWFQFFSLFFLLIGTSFIQITQLIITFLIKKFKKSNSIYFQFILSNLKLILIIFCLLFILIKAIFMAKEFKFKSQYPSKTSILRFSFKTKSKIEFSPIICFPILILINQTIDDDDAINEINKKNKKILNNLTFNEIKLKTDHIFKKMIINIAIETGYEQKNLNWSIRNEVLFRNNSINNQTYLSRCYLIEFKIIEMKYESLMPINLLVINFRTKLWNLYLVERKEEFSIFSNYFKGEFFLIKEITKNSPKSLKSNCTDYKNFKYEFNCTSRSNCIDQCIQFKFKEKYKKITIYSVITDEQINKSIKFVDYKDLNIENKCLKLFKREDCTKINYLEGFKTSYAFKAKSIYLNLNFENFNIIELDQSLINLILEIINLESIFIGTNIMNLFLSINLILTTTIRNRFKKIKKLRKRIKKLIKFKISKLLILSLCSIGFLIHIVNIFTDIINNKLIESTYFEKIKYAKIPNTIFCFKINKSIDFNYKLTGSYLDKISNNLNFTEIFQFIWYFDGTNRYPLKSDKIGKSNNEIKFKYFYYLNLKCFEIELDIKFKEEHFFSIISRNVFGLYFKKEFSDKFEYVYFLYREAKTKQFSNAYYFKINCNLKYQILFERFKFTKFDIFEKIKTPKLLFKKINSNDATIYFNKTINDLEIKYNLTTRKILLEENKFNLEIDDNLFKQYYLQVQNHTDHKYLHSLNYKKNFYNQFTIYNHNDKKETGFLFSPSFLSKIIKIENESNFTKLIINLLNALSFWWSICILDLYIYLNKFTKLIRKLIFLSNCFHLFLNNLKFRLEDNIFNV